MAKLTGKSIVFTGTPATMTRGEAANPATSKARLKKLAGTSVELARLVAKNPSTAADYLEELSGSSDKSVRSNIAGNPSSPVAAVMAVGSQFPEQMLLNPSFDLYLLSEPRLLEGIGVSALRALLKRDFCPVSFFSYAARQDDEATQLAVLVNPNVPRAVVEKLCASKYPRVTEAASSHRVFSSDAKPSQHKWQTAFETGLINELANVETVSAVHKSLAFLLLSDEPALQQLSEAELWVIRTAWSSRERADHVRSQDVRAEIASNPSTPLPLKISLLEALAKDEDSDVRSNVAKNPSTPLPLKISLLEALAKDKEQNVRSNVARNPSTPVSLLKALAKDKDEYVRRAVASHPSTPVSLLEALAKDKDEYVRRDVASNPFTPGSVLEALALEPALTDNAHRSNVESALGKASTSLELRTELMKKVCAGLKPSYARTLVLMLPDCPASALTKCGKSSLWLERCAVAQNTATPHKLAAELKKDKHSAVSAAAQWRLSQSVS